MDGTIEMKNNLTYLENLEVVHNYFSPFAKNLEFKINVNKEIAFSLLSNNISINTKDGYKFFFIRHLGLEVYEVSIDVNATQTILHCVDLGVWILNYRN